MKLKFSLPHWTLAAPVNWIGVLHFIQPYLLNDFFTFRLWLSLIAVRISAVQHDRVAAHGAGDPYGTLLLAIAVTVIGVSLFVFLVMYGGTDSAAFARKYCF